MLDHVSIGVRDIAETKRFYDAALKSLGYECLSESEGSLGYGMGNVAFWISESQRPVTAHVQSGLHFCFAAPTRASVDAFHAAALKSGGYDGDYDVELFGDDISPDDYEPLLHQSQEFFAKLVG